MTADQNVEYYMFLNWVQREASEEVKKKVAYYMLHLLHERNIDHIKQVLAEIN